MITVVDRCLGILSSYLAQVFFFGQMPSTYDITGSVIITATVLLISIREVVDDRADGNSTARSVFCLGNRTEADLSISDPLLPAKKTKQ